MFASCSTGRGHLTAQGRYCCEVMATGIPEEAGLARLKNELCMGAELDPSWAVLPRTLVRHDGRPALVMEDPGGQPLDRLIGKPNDILRFLELAVGVAAALRSVHCRI